MRYKNAKAFVEEPDKSILVFGMSGVGKSHVSSLLTEKGCWTSHSIDQRIGELLKKAILADYEASDFKHVSEKLASGDLSPLVNFLGKPGSIKLGGRRYKDYKSRLSDHRRAEKFALVEAPRHFDVVKREVSGPTNFICDTGGSMCEVLQPMADRRLLSAMSQRMLFVYIEAETAYDEVLVDRFTANPKPMYYSPDFLDKKWEEYLYEHKVSPEDVLPDEFAKWGFQELVKHRRPLYEAIAKKWGVTVSAKDVSDISDAGDFLDLVCTALDRRTPRLATSKKSLGKDITRQRQYLKMSQRRLAQLVGVDENLLSRIERDKAYPSERLDMEFYKVLYLDPLVRKRTTVNRSRATGAVVTSEMVRRKR